jgi:hypothetical protein
MKPNRGIYIVKADNGVGEFLWYKEDEAAIPVCEGNVYSLMDKGDPDPIMSGELFSDFCKWAELFQASFSIEGEPVGFDWVEFNDLGLGLAKRFKSEWGDQISVRYVRPSQDPGRKRLEFTEIE